MFLIPTGHQFHCSVSRRWIVGGSWLLREAGQVVLKQFETAKICLYTPMCIYIYIKISVETSWKLVPSRVVISYVAWCLKSVAWSSSCQVMAVMEPTQLSRPPNRSGYCLESTCSIEKSWTFMQIYRKNISYKWYCRSSSYKIVVMIARWNRLELCSLGSFEYLRFLRWPEEFLIILRVLVLQVCIHVWVSVWLYKDIWIWEVTSENYESKMYFTTSWGRGR